MSLKEIREQINLIDTKMADLFIRRMEAIREIAVYKRERGLPIEDREQEARVIEAHSSRICDEAMRSLYIQFLQNTMDVSKRWQHRLTASAIDCPVGMKNPTSGDLTVMMNAILAAQHQHDFIYRGWEGHSDGNPYAHAILRGYVNQQGVTHPNYHYDTLLYLADLYDKWDLQNPALVVDCNHANSGKNPFGQSRIMEEVLHSCRYNLRMKKLVKGFMVESYIEDGNQPVDGGVYGKSITDACLGWEKSKRMIFDMAEAL